MPPIPHVVEDIRLIDMIDKKDAMTLGMTTVAEGVKDLDTYMRLREMGCHAAQGYFIGRPMPAERAVAWSHRLNA